MLLGAAGLGQPLTAPWMSANVLTAAARRDGCDLVSAQGLWSCCFRPTGSKVLLITPPIKEKVLNVLLIIIQATGASITCPSSGLCSSCA